MEGSWYQRVFKGGKGSRSGQREKSNYDTGLMTTLTDTELTSGAKMAYQNCALLCSFFYHDWLWMGWLFVAEEIPEVVVSSSRNPGNNSFLEG